MSEGWLERTRASYEIDAEGYAEEVSDLLAGHPHLRASLDVLVQDVRERGGGEVADVGCGTGYVVRHLHEAGLQAMGIDLSPAMIRIARRQNPGLRFEVGSMTDLGLPDASLAGIVAFWSIVHVPDHALPGVLGELRRVLCLGAPLLIGFHVGDTGEHTDIGYTGRVIDLDSYRRRPEDVCERLRSAGFAIDAEVVLHPDEEVPGALIHASA